MSDDTKKPKKGLVYRVTIKRPKTSHNSEKHRAESTLRPPHVLDRDGPSHPHDALERTPSLAAKQWETVKTPRDPLISRVMRHRETGEMVAVTVHPIEHTESFYVSLGQAFGDPWERISRQQRAHVLHILENYLAQVDSATAEVALEHYALRLRVPYTAVTPTSLPAVPRGKSLPADSLPSLDIGEETGGAAVPPFSPSTEEKVESTAAASSTMDVELDGKPVQYPHPEHAAAGTIAADTELGGKSTHSPDSMPGANDVPVSNAVGVGVDRPGAGGEYLRVSATRKRALPVFSSSPVTDAEIRKTKLTPGLTCDNCAIGIECPEYSQGYVCAYNPAFKAFPSRSQELVLGGMRHIVDKNRERMMRAYHYEEVVNGGQIDPNVTRLSETVMAQTSTLLELERESVRAELEIGGESGDEKKPGILSKLFGGQTEDKPKSLPAQTTTVLPTTATFGGTKTRDAVTPIRAEVVRKDEST